MKRETTVNQITNKEKRNLQKGPGIVKKCILKTLGEIMRSMYMQVRVTVPVDTQIHPIGKDDVVNLIGKVIEIMTSVINVDIDVGLYPDP